MLKHKLAKRGWRAWLLCLVLASGLFLSVPSLVLADPPAATPGAAPTAPAAPTPAPVATAPVIPPAPPVAFRSIQPNPEVPIPGVRFTPATQSNGVVSIPFLAQYITGIYRVSVGLGAILAAIMIVYGGFRYLLAATLPGVKEGKEVIQNAFIGLVVLLSSYLILNTINPALVTEPVIRVTYVNAENAAVSDNDLGTTHGSTAGAETIANAPAAPGTNLAVPLSTSCPIQNLPEGHIDCGHASQPACNAAHCTGLTLAPGCSDNAVEPDNDPRVLAFTQQIQASLSSITDANQRAVNVATAAANCSLHLGSCGHGADLIHSIANDPLGSKFSSSDLTHQLQQIRCERPATGCTAAPDTCVHDAGQAVARVRDLVRTAQDSRADLLQPGDKFYIYNANAQDCTGQHSDIFLSWDGPRARIVWGQWGSTMQISEVCLRTSCPGGNFAPITKIF